MEPLNVVEYISSRFVLSSVAPVVNSLPLEHSEESLAGSIIATMTDRAHAAYQAVAAEISLVVTTGKLTASI
jgi:hypothetical protein|tara:strand:+ start:87 stop:302 length:216 start_codon:yes stop_codon:yes gene_type:complete